MRSSLLSKMIVAAAAVMVVLWSGPALAYAIWVDGSGVPSALRPGDEFEVAVKVETQTTRLGYYYLPVVFDKSLLWFKSARGGSSQELTAPIIQDQPFFSYLKVEDLNNRSLACTALGNITLVYLKFQVLPTAGLGEMTEISLNPEIVLKDCSDVAFQGSLPPWPWPTAQIEITPLVPGQGGSGKFMDLTLDGLAQEADAIILHKIIEGNILQGETSLFANNARQCDIMGNGLSDLYDAGRMDALTRPVRTINAGGDGICDSLALLDDVPAIAQDRGEPNAVVVEPGFNYLLDSPPCAGLGLGGTCDDVVVGAQILAGPDGVAQSIAIGDDHQTIADGEGLPQGVCILPGLDQIITSIPFNDDEFVSDPKLLTDMLAMVPQVGVPNQLVLVHPTQNPAYFDAVVPVPITVAVLDENGRPKTGLSPVFNVMSGPGRLLDGSQGGAMSISGLESDVFGQKAGAVLGQVTAVLDPIAPGPTVVRVLLPGDPTKGVPDLGPIDVIVNVEDLSYLIPSQLSIGAAPTQVNVGEPVTINLNLKAGSTPVPGAADRIKLFTRRDLWRGLDLTQLGQDRVEAMFLDQFETGNFSGGGQGAWTVSPGNGQLVVNTQYPGLFGTFSVKATDYQLIAPKLSRTVNVGNYRDVQIGYQWAFVRHPVSPNYNVHFITEISTNGGVSWRKLRDVTGAQDLLGGTGIWMFEKFDLKGVAALNGASFQLRFTFDVGNGATYPQTIYLDNVIISGGHALIQEDFESYTAGDFPASLDPTTYIGTGPDGILNTTPAGDDETLFGAGNGQANARAIQAGPDLTLESTPAGDDLPAAGPIIHTGANGVCQTNAAPTDYQEISLGHGKPFTRAINPGFNRRIDAATLGNDDQLVAPMGPKPRIEVTNQVWPSVGNGQGALGSNYFLIIGRALSGNTVENYHAGFQLDLSAYEQVTIGWYSKTRSQVDVGLGDTRSQEYALEVSDNGGMTWVRVWDNAGKEDLQWTLHQVKLQNDDRFTLVDGFLIRWLAAMDHREDIALDSDAVYLDNLLITGVQPLQDRFTPVTDLGGGNYHAVMTSYQPGQTVEIAAGYWPATIDPFSGRLPLLALPPAQVKVLLHKVEPGSIQVLPPSFSLKACQSMDVMVVGRYLDTPPGKVVDLTDLFNLVVNGPGRQTGVGKVTADCFIADEVVDIFVSAVPRVPGLYDPSGDGGGTPTGDVSGKIYIPTTYAAAASAPVWLDLQNGSVIYSHADTKGMHFFEDVPVGSNYKIYSSKQGYARNSKTISVTAGGNTSASIVLLSGANFDGDGQNDSADTDDDGDNVADSGEGSGSSFDPDSDGDGIPDSQDAFPANLNESLDTDRDGSGDNTDTDDDNDAILDAEEAAPGADGYITDPKDPDTDNGGENDGAEVAGGRNPTNGTDDLGPGDPDADGLTNTAENASGTNPNNPDTDGDGLCDGNVSVGACVAGEDLDKDGVLDSNETDPKDADTDDDGLNDQKEITSACANPRLVDTDGDGYCDGAIAIGACKAGEDLDADGVVDPTETSPCDSDSDDDLIPDGYEKENGLNPRLNDAAGDLDADGLTNAAEFGNNTKANYWDTDHDALPDGFEAGNSPTLNPNNAADGALDTDADTNANKHEYWNGSNLFSDNPFPDVFANPACYYWADGDGDGVVGPGDIAVIKSEVAGTPQNYGAIIPPRFDPLDIDKDGVPGPGDIASIQGMSYMATAGGGYPSTPSALTLVYPLSAPNVTAGNTTHVTVSARGTSGGVPYVSGFGVVFYVISGSATILGGDGAAFGDAAGNRYDMSGRADQNGKSTVVVRVDAAGPVVIGVKIPACGTAGYGRWMSQISLSPTVTINGQ